MTFKKKLIKDITTKINTWNPKAVSKSQKFEYIDIAAVSRELKEITTSLSLETSEAPSRARQIIKERDVLVSTVRPNLNAVARVTSDFDGATASTGFTVLRPKPNELDPDYLYYWVCSPCFVADMTQQSTGASYPAVSDTIVKNSKIPLPPIAEQKRIAAILDKADAVRRKRREAIRLTEELLRSVFLDMFGDPVTNPMGWDVVSMSEVISNIQAGQSLKGEEREKKEGELGVLKVSAVTSGYFQENEYKVVDSFDIKKKVVIPKKGDLLFSRANTRELVAATCIVERDARDVFLPDKLWRIDVNENRATSEYLKFLLTDPEYRSLLTRKATGTSGSMLNISQTKLLEMNLPLPELNRQRKFSKFFWLITKGKSLITDTIQESEDLFNSLLQHAFTGNL
jgi:type I restriction enzyme S subunit